MIWRDWQMVLGNSYDPAVLFGRCIFFTRLICIVAYSILLVFQLFGQVNIRLLCIAALLSLLWPLYLWITLFMPTLRIPNLFPQFLFFDIYLPAMLLIFSRRYRRADRQLQRENGLI
jgi:hypothetical protein